MPNGASMKDCIFRAHDERFLKVIGESPQIVRLAKKEHDFAHEVSVSVSQSDVLCVHASWSRLVGCFCTSANDSLLHFKPHIRV